MKLVLATRNRNKVRELSKLVAHLGMEVLSLEEYPDMPDVVEDGETFEENALKKAREVVGYTNLMALADDSGLEVDLLNGAPGVHSARFAGEDKDDDANNQKLLRLLEGVPAEKRTARFRCVVAIATPGGQVYITDGACEGIIGTEPRGSNGFGYDPLFYMPEYNKTFAELDMETKNKISHRGRALALAGEILAGLKE